MDKQSANRIIEQYFKKIYGYSIKKCFSYDEAEELCAAIGAQLWVALLKTDDISNPDGFVWQVCEHVYSKHLRAKLKPVGEGKRVSLYEADYPFQDDFSAAEQKEEYDRLRVEIAFLTKTRREIVYLHYFERVPIAEISRRLSLPVGTVKWHLNKARDELRKDYTMERKIGKSTIKIPILWACGIMERWSYKYNVSSVSVDSVLCSRVGAWQNNLSEDYEYLYEYIIGAIDDTPSNAEKFARLRERKLIDDNGRVNIMVASDEAKKRLSSLPELSAAEVRKYIDAELEATQIRARDYPEHMRDLIMSDTANVLLGLSMAVIVLNKLYENGTFKPLTENEKVTSQLIMFSDKLPE